MRTRESLFVQNTSSTHSDGERQPWDYYATPPHTIDDLAERVDIDRNVWEPACGENHLVKKLRERGHDVYATDIIDRGYNESTLDFLAEHKTWHGDIITNPPYSLAQEFVEHGMELLPQGKRLAMFLKIQFLEGKRRSVMFQKYPPRYVFIYSYRINCLPNGEEPQQSSAACYCWFVWEKGYKGRPQLDWII